jgi:integrase
MAKSHLKLVTPTIVKRTVTSKRPANGKLRTREYLTEAEVARLMTAAKGNRWGHRDATMILVAYRHGLRASELVDLRWAQVEFGTAALHVRRIATDASYLILLPLSGHSGHWSELALIDSVLNDPERHFATIDCRIAKGSRLVGDRVEGEAGTPAGKRPSVLQRVG